MSFQVKSRIASETSAIITSCTLSSGEMARMFPKTMVSILTDAGLMEIMNRPSAKKPLKIRPITDW